MTSSAIMYVNTFLTQIGQVNSQEVLLDSWSDCDTLFLLVINATVAEVQISHDFDPLNPGAATWTNISKTQNNVGANWSTGSAYEFKAAGKAIRTVLTAAAAGTVKTSELWKKGLIG